MAADTDAAAAAAAHAAPAGKTSLEALIAELEEALAERDEQIAEQCRIAAHEEGKVVEARLTEALQEAASQSRVLREAASARQEEREARAARLARVEERLSEAEQREERLRDREDRRRARQLRTRQLEAERRAEADALRADARRARRRGMEAVAQLRRSTDAEEQDCARLRERLRSSEEIAAAHQGLRSSLEASQRRVQGFEESAAELRDFLRRRDAQGDELREEVCGLERAAAERVEGELCTALRASEARAADLAQRAADLRHADALAGELAEQLRVSTALVPGIEQATAAARGAADAIHFADEPPESWQQEREHLEAQVLSMREAEEAALRHVAAMECDLTELQVSLPGGGVAERTTEEEEAARGRALAESAELEALLRSTHLYLDAKERRLQLLLAGADGGGTTSNGSHVHQAGDADPSADLRLEELDRRAWDLESEVSELGAQLDEGADRLRRLEYRRAAAEEEVERRQLERSRAQEERLRELRAELRELSGRAGGTAWMRGDLLRGTQEAPGRRGRR